MPSFDEITNLFWPMKSEWNKKNHDLKLCSNMLMDIKIALINHNFLSTNVDEPSFREYLFTREILEIGVQCSIGMHDIPSFEMYMTQLKPYYLDYKHRMLPKSCDEYHMFGLNLLFLLSQNRVGEFHTELELLPLDIIQTNQHIIHVVTLEQYLTEGNYNKIFESKNKVPSDTYNFFMSILLNTVRDQISECLQKAYEKVKIYTASEMLNFKNIDEMKEFANKKKWILNEDEYFVFLDEEKKEKIKSLPALQIINYTCQYAHNLDSIV